VNHRHEIRLPPQTLDEVEAALRYLSASIEKIERDLASRTEETWVPGISFTEWRRKTAAARDVHAEQRLLFLYYREVLRTPSPPDAPPWTRHLNTYTMREPITLEEAEAGVEALTAAIRCCDASVADIRERGETSERALKAIDRATVARRHYSEALPAMTYARARLHADTYGPTQHLEAFVRSLPETVRESAPVKLAVACLRGIVGGLGDLRATEARRAA
jgi:hypothetical protein